MPKDSQKEAGTLKDTLIIFCDGACSGNPGPGGWGAVVVTATGTVREMGNYALKTTNNQMELLAVIEALRAVASESGSTAIYTDSVYVIRGITQWIWGWRQRGWKTADGNDVANKDLWQQLAEQVARRKALGPLAWHYVRGHSGVPGNERCDEIAVAFAKTRKSKLYRGPLMGYDVAIHDIPGDTSLPEMKPKAAKLAAYSYLSLVDGKLMRHASWSECEQRVKGRAGAKFKKATSEDDEGVILKSWGLDS